MDKTDDASCGGAIFQLTRSATLGFAFWLLVGLGRPRGLHSGPAERTNL